MDINAKIAEFEEELRTTPYNKRTQGHIGIVKAKIAKLKELLQSRARGKGQHKVFAVKKTGDATVVLLGFPSVGKSTLLNALTNAESKTAAYPFTTLGVIPGLLQHRKAKIQLLDVPGIIEGAADGSGRGRESISVLQSADMALIIIDAQDLKQLDVVKQELYNAKFRINEEKPAVSIKPAQRGGIQLSATKLTKMTEQNVLEVLREFRVSNAYVTIREDITPEQLMDVIEDNRMYIPAVIAVNKIDAATNEEKAEAAKIKDAVLVSAEKGTNLGVLKEEIFRKLKIMRIYLKQAGKKADLNEPMIMKSGCAVQDVCLKLHREFINKFRFARIWGKSAKFGGQKVGLAHKLEDDDVVQINLR